MSLTELALPEVGGPCPSRGILMGLSLSLSVIIEEIQKGFAEPNIEMVDKKFKIHMLSLMYTRNLGTRN
jgi:hypothetical protein